MRDRGIWINEKVLPGHTVKTGWRNDVVPLPGPLIRLYLTQLIHLRAIARIDADQGRALMEKTARLGPR